MMLNGKGWSELVTIVGIRGQGKTTYLRHRLRQSRRALVYDPLEVMRPGLLCRSREEVNEALDNDLPNFRIVYQPQIDEKEIKRLQEEIGFLCDIARTIHDVSLYIDEIDSFGEWDKERLAVRIPSLHAAVNFGRRKEINIYGTVRRPQVTIPRVWIAESQTIVVFRTLDEYDRRTILEKCPKLTANDIDSLQRFQCIEYNRELAEFKRLTVPKDF